MIALLQNVVESPDAGSSASLRLLDLPPAWVIVLVVVPALVGVAWIGYARERIPRPNRVLLASLRFAALSLLCLVLARPVVVQRQERRHPAEVVVLLDDSASMRRQDAYAGDPEVRDTLQAFAPRAVEDTARYELVQAAVEEELLPRLEDRDYGVRMHAFSDVVTTIDGPSELRGRGHATHLGDALGQVLAANRGRHVTDVILVSDGRSTGGGDTVDAARAAASSAIPVHTVVVGDTRPERNAVLELVEVPPSVLEGDEIEIAVRVTGRGVSRSEQAHVLLEELPPEGSSAAPRLVAEDDVSLDESGERVTLVAPPAPIGTKGTERRFRVQVPPLEGETLVDDNQLLLSVHVSPQKVRVLYVDGYPRWEYRYLKNLLKRADANFEFQCFLLSATQDFRQEHSPDLPPLTEVPTTREELLDNYDVVILGDVPHSFTPDPDDSTQFHEALRGFVEAGGGVLFQAGEYDNPRAYKGTPLEELLPVLLPTSGVQVYDVDTTRMVRPLVENPHAPHEVVRLTGDTEVNRRLFEDPSGLYGFYWYYPIERAKPGAQVLLRHPVGRNAHGNHPLLVTGYFPSGRTMFLGIDSTWRWRFHFGDRYHERFWRNSIRWLALGRLRSGDRRYRLEATRSEFALDERVVLEARVLDEDYQPSERPTQPILVSGPDGRPEEIELGAVAGRPGQYRGSLDVDRPGLHRAWIEIDGNRVSTAEFDVVLPSRENADPSPDPGVLLTIATSTGGRAVTLASIGELDAELPGDEERVEPISSKLEDAWDRWATLICALIVFSAEWILRKKWELV